MLKKSESVGTAGRSAGVKVMSGSRRRRVLEAVGTTFGGIALLIGTLYFVDVRAVAQGLSRIGYGAATVAGILALTQVFICALRWQIVSRQTGGPLRLRDTLVGYFEATFVNAFFPTLIASDGVRVLRAIRSGASAMNALIGVVTDRIIALCALAVASATGIFFLPDATRNPWLLAAVVGIFPAFIFGLIVLDLIGRYFGKLSHWRIVRPFLELASYMRRLRKMPRLTILVLSVSLIGHMFCAGAFYILGQQLGMQIGYWSMFALAAPILVYAAVPISIGGWGIREAVTAALFGLVGYSASSAVALSIAFGLLMSVVGLLCGGTALIVNVGRQALRSHSDHR
jgi:glycosyltransferase 2 family protein